MTSSQLFNLEQSFTKTLDDYSLEMENRNAIAYQIVRDIFEKFPEKLSLYTTSPSTLLLRDLAKEVGFDYWGNLDHSNAVDFIDSAFALAR